MATYMVYGDSYDTRGAQAFLATLTIRSLSYLSPTRRSTSQYASTGYGLSPITSSYWRANGSRCTRLALHANGSRCKGRNKIDAWASWRHGRRGHEGRMDSSGRGLRPSLRHGLRPGFLPWPLPWPLPLPLLRPLAWLVPQHLVRPVAGRL